MESKIVKMTRNEILLDRIARRAAQLLKESENPQAEMEWAEARLREAGLFPLFLNPGLKNSRKWAQDVLEDSLDIRYESLPWVRAHNSHPVRAETFESLILDLISTEEGL